jgi:hypothetical protein
MDRSERRMIKASLLEPEFTMLSLDDRTLSSTTV